MSEAPATLGKTVTLTIDGASLEVPRGTTIIEAASSIGVSIPTLCYLKKLLPIASCRVCSVEVDGVNGPVMSCSTPVTDDMSVTTQSEALSIHRKRMIEFILVNHPLDCPVCERSGECSLQDRTFELGVTDKTMGTAYYEPVAAKDWGVIQYEQNLCVMCGRCENVCREVQGFNALLIDGSGYDAKMNTVDGEKLDCDFCGQCISVCPVGALNSGLVLSVRSWETVNTQTVCPHCAVGCSYRINVKNEKVVRVTSDDDIGVNNGNLCARGRFGYEAFQAKSRIKTPLLLNGGELEPASWENAISTAASGLKEIVKNHGAGSVAAIVSERVTNEDAYVIQKTLRDGFGINRINTLSNMQNADLNADIYDTIGSAILRDGYGAIADAGSFLFFGCDAAKENPVIANIIRTAMRDNATPLYIANSRNTGDFFPASDVSVKYNYGAEALLVGAIIKSINADGKDGDITKAASSTGVTVEEIELIARALGSNGPAIVFIGKEIHDHPSSKNIIRALARLAELTGGKILPYREYCNTQGVNDMGVSPGRLPGYVNADGKVDDGDIFDDMVGGKIKGVILVGVEPTVHFRDGGFVKKALVAVDFLVATDSHETATTKLANVVLPTRVNVERDGTYTNNEGRPQSIIKAVEPYGESKQEWEIFQALDEKAGMEELYSSVTEITDSIAKNVPGYAGVTSENLSWEDSSLVNYPGSRSSDAKFSEETLSLKSNGEYPYQALIGNSLYHLDQLSRNSSGLNGIEPVAYVEISPEDAQGLGVSQGDEVSVSSKNASIKVVARILDRSPAGIVFIPKNYENAPALTLVNQKEAITWVKISKIQVKK